MDVGATIKTAASIPQGAPGVFARPTLAPTQQVVATELPASKSVSAATTSSAIRNDAPRAAGMLTRDVQVDYQTREVILRLLDPRSRVVVHQVPSEALLRLRAYTRAIADGETPTQAQNHANFHV
jgi:hypothetical protein